jgi:hypothetical protein
MGDSTHKIHKRKQAGDMAQVVQHLPGNCEALSSSATPHPIKRQLTVAKCWRIFIVLQISCFKKSLFHFSLPINLKLNHSLNLRMPGLRVFITMPVSASSIRR